jgi:predicted transcriptional regulator
MVKVLRKYRERVFIVKDLIFHLTEHERLSRTALYEYCQLNLKTHHSILDDLESNGLVNVTKVLYGKKIINTYEVTSEGISFYKDILDPYEKIFPRARSHE